METVQNTNVSISEPLLEIIKPSVVAVLRQRLLFTYRIRTCSSYFWVTFDLDCKQSDSLWASRKAQRCDSLQSSPRESRAWHGWVWVTAEHWQPSATGSRIRLGGKASLPAHLIYFWFVKISKTETKSTLSWLLWKTDTWMALCIVYSVVLEHCCAVSTLLCGSHSLLWAVHRLSWASQQQLHMSHLFDQLQGQPRQRNSGRLPWQLVALQHNQSVPGLTDCCLHHPLGAAAPSPQSNERTVPLEVLFHQCWRSSRESVEVWWTLQRIIYAYLCFIARRIWQNILKILQSMV